MKIDKNIVGIRKAFHQSDGIFKVKENNSESYTKLINSFCSYMSSHMLFQISSLCKHQTAFDALEIRTIQMRCLVIRQCFGITEIDTTVIAFTGWRLLLNFMCSIQMNLIYGDTVSKI